MLFPLVVSAQGLTGTPIPQGTAQGDLATVILNLINYVLAIVGVIALAFLVYGGFRYITSAGNEDAIAAAKLIILNAIIGIVVIGVAAALVNFVIRGVGGNVPAGAI
jgi:heme/copper-type cytochrome/quinol oxidase subunit 2